MMLVYTISTKPGWHWWKVKMAMDFILMNFGV